MIENATGQSPVNHKRVERIWRQEGLKVLERQPKRGRLWLDDGSCIRLRPLYRGHVWSYDFVASRTHDGRALKLLTVLDEHTRECLAIVVACKIRAHDVLEVLADLFVRHGPPEYLRSDNGPEVHREARAAAVGARGRRDALYRAGQPVGERIGRRIVERLMRPDGIEGAAEVVEVTLLGTEVGLRRPSSFALEGSVHAFVTAILLRLTRLDGYNESFNGKLRDELLNGEIFYSLAQAAVLVEQWRREYNTIRPHSACGGFGAPESLRRLSRRPGS